MATLLTIEEAQRLVLERVRPLSPETVALERAAGSVLAEAAVARVDLPPFASSAMDGFALRAADVPGTLPVVARIAAGRPATQALAPGQAMAIATGGAVPRARMPSSRSSTLSNMTTQSTCRPESSQAGTCAGAGATFTAGAVVVPPAPAWRRPGWGRSPRPAFRRAVRTAPASVVLATGTELSPGEDLGPGEIYEANGLLLEAARARGAEVERLPLVEDDAAHRAAIARGLAADVLVTTGGVSVGPHDLVRQIEAELGVEEVFWRVAVKPGKPIAFGVRGATLVFGLPGQPRLDARRLRALRAPAVLALQSLTDPCRCFAPAGSPVRSGATPRATSCSGRTSRSTATVPCSIR